MTFKQYLAAGLSALAASILLIYATVQTVVTGGFDPAVGHQPYHPTA